jgi:hypothetical protein
MKHCVAAGCTLPPVYGMRYCWPHGVLVRALEQMAEARR